MKGARAEESNGFAFLRSEIRRRVRKPIGQTGFWLYLFLAVFGVGWLAIYIEGWRYFEAPPRSDAKNLELALYTVFPAILGSSAVQLALDKNNSPTRNAGIAALVSCVLLATVLIKNIGVMSDRLSIGIGLIACVFSVFVWWIANADEPIFQDQIHPEATVGGDVNAPLSGGPGDIKL